MNPFRALAGLASSRAWHLFAWLALLAGGAMGDALHDGETIYRAGMLPSGAPVIGQRGSDLTTTGPDAACVNCHRRSGLGMKEGQVSIPPISGIYLFHPRATNRDDFDLPFVENIRPDRDPYTEATLARAIRDGVDVDGHPMSLLMPHYTLSDSDVAALTMYLKSMTHGPVPGVTQSVLHFATIVTPDADAAKRKGVLDVLQQFFKDKSDFTRAETPRLQSSHRMMFKAPRRWQLHVWELEGAPETWEAQLQQDLAKEPVFAVISGVGGKTWAPVHRFCERARLPCLFPNVELPVVAEQDFYSLYFSKGVLLEAQLLASELGTRSKLMGGRVVQIFRANDVGAAAARELTADVTQAGRVVIERPLKSQGTSELSRAVRGLERRDVAVLWLRAQDLTLLQGVPVPEGPVMVSGLMGGLGAAPIPQRWRERTEMAYPFDLPQKRVVRVDYALGWFKLRHIPVVAEQAQADTYLACGLLSETLNHMADTFFREYLVERIEATLEHRVVTGYYPWLSLAPGQHFASKGGYLVRFADSSGTKIAPLSDWVVP